MNNRTGVTPAPGIDPNARKAQVAKDGKTTSAAVGTAMRHGYEPQGEGWTDVSGGGAIFQWEEGRYIRGQYLRLREGQFGPDTLADIVTTDEVRDAQQRAFGPGLVTIGVPTVLRQSLGSVPVNDEVYIECVGSVATSRGLNQALIFKVKHRSVQQKLNV